jgi:rfaE bifunctional protein kinase chain/domain
MKFNSIDKIFEAFRNVKVLIIGDVMVDTYIYGSVTRISPEAPVPIMNVKRRENRLGGAANVALNIQALGGEPLLCSIIGDDLQADEFIRLLKDRKMQSSGIIRSQRRMTTVKNRLISGSHHLLRIDEEMDSNLESLDIKALKSHIDKLLDQCDVVVFEDYDKGCLNESVITYVIEQSRQRGIPTAVDPKRRNFSSYKQATLFKPNLKELKDGLNQDIDPSDFDQLHRVATDLRKSMDQYPDSNHP